jgi:metal-dependent amidase/aminoacylase/carboxypeptidase family protein
MGFLRKIKFRRKRNNNTKVDAAVPTEVPPICDAATVTTDLTVMFAAYTHVETKTDGGDAVVAAEHVCESELDIKTQKIQELQEELVVSRRLTAELMLNMSSVEQQLRKYAEEPVSSWSDDCECKEQVSAVAE